MPHYCATILCLGSCDKHEAQSQTPRGRVPHLVATTWVTGHHILPRPPVGPSCEVAPACQDPGPHGDSRRLKAPTSSSPLRRAALAFGTGWFVKRCSGLAAPGKPLGRRLSGSIPDQLNQKLLGGAQEFVFNKHFRGF